MYFFFRKIRRSHKSLTDMIDYFSISNTIFDNTFLRFIIKNIKIDLFKTKYALVIFDPYQLKFI